MFDWLFHFFSTDGFPPRWDCGSGWVEEPIVGWLHIFSDLAIFASYYAVPCVVAWFVMRHHAVKFPLIFWVFFGLIFFSCGSVHLVEAGIFWWPQYRLSALLKFVTAVVSSIGVVVLARSLPRALDLKTPEQLQAEIVERPPNRSFQNGGPRFMLGAATSGVERRRWHGSNPSSRCSRHQAHAPVLTRERVGERRCLEIQ